MGGLDGLEEIQIAMNGNLLKYSNGWGHLIMSLAAMATGLVMILATPDLTIHASGVTLILTASGYWFVTGAANKVVQEIKQGGDSGHSTNNNAQP